MKRETLLMPELGVNGQSNPDRVEPKPFDLEKYLSDKKQSLKTSMSGAQDRMSRFLILCHRAYQYINDEWNGESTKTRSDILLTRQKRAILGFPEEVNYFKDKIIEFLKANRLEEEVFPDCYTSLADGIFHENWGLSVLAGWMTLTQSSSAKIIGNRVYYLNPQTGKMELQDHRITRERVEQLRKALLLSDRTKRLDDDYSEVYMHSGERVTIYTGDLVLKGQSTLVFRKSVIEALTFEEQARRGTIPYELIPCLKAMAGCGVNVAFIGPIRSGKSTMLLTWQMYERPDLEGVFIQTDPEIRIHEVMPHAPIMNLIADGEELLRLVKKVLRSDADYIVVAEGRDGYAFHVLVDAANKGTNRNKTTVHLSRAEDFAYDIASKLNQIIGGHLDYQIVRVANSFNYIFEMIQLPENKAQKRLSAIYEMRSDPMSHEITYHKICAYDRKSEGWTFHYTLGERVKEIGAQENPEALEAFSASLESLAQDYPMMNPMVLRPLYSGKKEALHVHDS